MKSMPEYWIWLQKSLGAGKSLNDILDYFGSPEKLYSAGRKKWLESGTLTNKDIEKLVMYSPSQSYDVIKQCKDNGWSIVTYDDDAYPELLKQIYGFPAVLYVWGDVSALNSKVLIGMVGTRDASDYGISVAEGLSYSLAKAGAVIVSGGALGIDKASHRGAVVAGGKTVAVLGCGLGHNYLAENAKMRQVISRNGAVISEYLPFSPPSKQTFPIRNRLISGLTLGTVVIEAGEKSGSLITAKLAAEQGRDVFAVPGNVMSSKFFGTNRLIRDGVKPVFTAMDVLDEYTEQYGEYLKLDKEYLPLKTLNKAEKRRPAVSQAERKEEKREEKKPQSKEKTEIPPYATENAKKLLGVMTNEPKLTDELVSLSGLSVNETLSSLTELEMYSLVTIHSGNRFSLI